MRIRLEVMASACAACLVTISASAQSVFIASDNTGAQVFLNRQDRTYWEFGTNSFSVANFAGASLAIKKNGSATGSVYLAVIAGTYSNFTAGYDSSTGVYSGPSLILTSLGLGSFSTSFAQTLFAGSATTLAANSTFTAVVWATASGVGADTYYIKKNSQLFWSDANGDPNTPPGYSPNEDLTQLAGNSGGGGGVPLPGAAGLAACGLLGLSRRRRR